jgi:streptomycin 6-kinase
MTTIPDRLRAKALAVGNGREWLAGLPDACRRLTDEWSVRLGTPFADCHVSLVVRANRGSVPLVLKVPMPATIELGTLAGGARAGEADVLRTWAGDGAVQLLEHDRATGAMLLERCVPGAPLDDDPDDVAAELLHRLHRPGPPSIDRLADRAARLARDLPARFEAAGAPFDRWLIETTVEYLEQLSRPGPAEVLLHGDFQHPNVLSASRRPWLVIDPLPMLGDPAYDAVQYLLFRKGDLADPETEWAGVIARFCGLLNVDAERVKAWTFARLVSDALESYVEGTPPAELESRQSDLWSARLVRRIF